MEGGGGLLRFGSTILKGYEPVMLQFPTIAYEPLAVSLAAVLGASVVVERVVEGAKNVLDLTRLKRAKRQLGHLDDATRPVEKFAAVLHEADERDAAEASLESQPARAPEGNPVSAVPEWDEQLPSSTIVIQKANDPDRTSALRAFLIQTLATVTGIVVAHYAHLTLFRTLSEAIFGASIVSPPGDYLLTGLVIGGGSAPAHLLIRFISERRMAVEAASEIDPAPDAAAASAAPVSVKPVAARTRVSTEVSVEPDQWVDIPYTGGIDRGLLEGIHHRPDDPNLIVYHHTAMHRASSMDDLVRVIKDHRDRNGNHWTTGYHCAILEDGTIHAFCRWDRYGCHAAGYNRRSLGIAFMGNFETDPAVPFANADGRYGPAHPSEAQVNAGARVVALWTFLYGLDADFAKVIIPHKQIAPKSCPGENFPYEGFEKLVRYFRDSWAGVHASREHVRAFAAQPFLYVDPRTPKLRFP